MRTSCTGYEAAALAVCFSSVCFVCAVFRDHFPDQPFVERREIVRLAAGGEIPVGDHFFIDPVTAGVANIRAHRWPGGEGFLLQDASFDQEPGTVADDADRFA